MRTLATIALLALPIEASAEMKVSARITLDGITVSISGAHKEQVEEGDYCKLLSTATKQARKVWKCDMLKLCNSNMKIPEWIEEETRANQTPSPASACYTRSETDQSEPPAS